jgi:hypothetical protein
MTNLSTKEFKQLYPGPYVCQPGTNGVDNTFDIVCSNTGKHVISTAYWYEEERAERDASVVTLALELMRKARFEFDGELQERLDTAGIVAFSTVEPSITGTTR